jgi:hypothetical protein
MIDDEQRRALELLAGWPEGLTETRLLARHKFTSDALAALVRDGLATSTIEKVRGGKYPAQVTRYKITDAGLLAMD